MPRRPPRRNGDRGRRNLLAAVATGIAGIGLGVNVLKPSAYTSARAGRSASANVAGDTEGALLGLLVNDPVKRNKQELLVEITNNTDQTLNLNVSLDTPSQGTLFGPNGSGDTVSLTLAAGATESVDIESREPDGTVVPFSIVRNAYDFSFDLSRETTVQSGNTSDEVSIDKINQFRIDEDDDRWTVRTLEASSTNYELETVELDVVEQSSGTTVGSKTYDNINGTEFAQAGKNKDPGVVIQPDDSTYDVRSKKDETYELTVTATDAAGNFARQTKTR
jgi:hypothetical protein